MLRIRGPLNSAVSGRAAGVMIRGRVGRRDTMRSSIGTSELYKGPTSAKRRKPSASKMRCIVDLSSSDDILPMVAARLSAGLRYSDFP